VNLAAAGHGGTYLKLLATMFLWGGTWVAARHAVQTVAPLGVAVWRFLFAAASLLVLVVWKHGRPPAPTRRELLLILGLGATGIFLYNLFFLYGMRHIAAGRGALVVAASPIVTLLAAAWLLREGMTARKALGSLLALAGCLTVIGKGDPLALLGGKVGAGETLILGCAFMWSAYTLIGRLGTRSMSALVMTAYASAAGFLMLLVAALLHDPAQLVPDYAAGAWTAILFLGLFGTTLGFTWFSAAVQEIGAQRASIFINLVPVAAVLQGAWLLDERLDPSVLAGGALVIAGVMLTQRPTIKLKEATP
jgi:drug/metabolite transporter (DMT)-like permease